MKKRSHPAPDSHVFFLFFFAIGVNGISCTCGARLIFYFGIIDR